VRKVLPSHQLDGRLRCGSPASIAGENRRRLSGGRLPEREPLLARDLGRANLNRARAGRHTEMHWRPKEYGSLEPGAMPPGNYYYFALQ
jgi:hypothetical protein